MPLIEWLKVVLFGIVEGITEWLPVSSTGHMILLDDLIKLNVTPEFYSVFEVVIQLGAILAVIICLWPKIWPFGRNKTPFAREGFLSYVNKDIIIMWLKAALACVPGAIVGIAGGDTFDRLFYNHWCVAIALIVFGVAIILAENSRVGKKARVKRLKDLDIPTVIVIGLFQVLAAIFPGTSRSGATIVGALLLGVSRRTAAEFTFILAIPVMAGASLLKLLDYGLAFSASELLMLLLAMAVAFAVSMLVIRKILSYIRKHNYKPFGWYRIGLGIVVLLYWLIFK